MKASPLHLLRTGVVLLGALAGVLLVRALDEGFQGGSRPLDFGHLALGLLMAAVVMPGPLLGYLVTPASSENARGLAVGASAVTGLAAALGGAMLMRRLDAPTTW